VDTPTLGVEEEFFLVDARTGLPAARPPGLLETVPGAEPELQRWQVETNTRVCADLATVRAELVRLRRDLVTAAEGAGCRLLATATHPLATRAHQDITPKARYRRMEDRFAQLARDQLVCGCHVHVGVADRELAVLAMAHLRPWLHLLLALSANSPFWMGADTGYASYRTQMWSRWPSAGPPAPFASAAEYDATVSALVGSGVVLDRAMVYFDVRPSAHVDTLEFRVADVCLTVDDAVLLAGLSRALVTTALAAVRDGAPPPELRTELVRAAHWRASRSGLGEELVDLAIGRPVPPEVAMAGLLRHVTPALEAAGDLDEVHALLDRTLACGTGADRQRAAHRGDLAEVVDLLARATVPA